MFGKARRAPPRAGRQGSDRLGALGPGGRAGWGACVAYLMVALSVVYAFACRSAATYASYRTRLVLGLASIVVSAITFYFVGSVVARAGPGFEARYGMTYSSYVLIGLFLHGVATAGLYSFRTAIRREQLQGTLELLLTTRLPPSAAILLSGLGEVLALGVGGAVLFSLASLVLGVELEFSWSLAAAAGLYTAAMCGVGLASAGVILVTKEGDPISWSFGALSGILGGVYFPVDLLPLWVQKLSVLLPTTHALRLARGQAASVAAGGELSVAFLVMCAALMPPLGLWVLRWGYERARVLGTLGQY